MAPYLNGLLCVLRAGKPAGNARARFHLIAARALLSSLSLTRERERDESSRASRGSNAGMVSWCSAAESSAPMVDYQYSMYSTSWCTVVYVD